MSNVSIFQNVAFHRFPDRERGSFLRRNRGHDTPSAKRKTKKTYPIHIVADKTVTTKSPTSTRLSNRINPVNIEESQSLWNFASFHAPAPSQSLSPPIPIGCSVEMPSRNHPSRLIESLTLMNIGSDRRARGTLFSPCLLSLPLPRVPGQRNPAPCRRCRLLACSFARVITRPPLVDRETIVESNEPSYPASFA